MLFFELLQVALGNRVVLSRVPSAQEWLELYIESERQAVTGLLLHGIEKLPAEQRPSQAFLLQWIGVVQLIEQRNHLMDERCVELLKSLNDYGLHGSILKGQGVALLYEKDLRPIRQSGDIDVYVDCGQKRALEVAKSFGQESIEWDYKHLYLQIWDDTEVELHYRVEVLQNPWKNARLQRWFSENDALLYDKRNGLTTPTTLFNIFYILLHIYRHFFFSGIGLRQIVDYYYVLRTVHNERLSADYPLDAVSQFGLERFSKGLMWVMHEAMGMSEEWMLWEPNQKEGEYILEQIMKGGNFGHYDKRLHRSNSKLGAVRNVINHNLHILSHYPSDTIWTPVWFMYHKLWKIKTKMTL